MTKAAAPKRWAVQNRPDGSKSSAIYLGYYERTFSGTEDPLADGYGGETNGIIFGDMVTSGGYAYVDRTITDGVNSYTDSLWLLSPLVVPLTLDHYVETTLRLAGSTSGTNEHEHLVRGKVNFSLYEIIWQRGGTGVQFVYQNGSKPGFTILDGSGGTPAPAGSNFAVAPANGDILRTRVKDNVGAAQIEITTHKALAASPTVFADGPYVYIPFASIYAIRDGYLAGIGGYVADGNTPSEYCCSRVKVGNW